MTKASNLHLIDRLQFPWLTASIVNGNRMFAARESGQQRGKYFKIL